MSEKQAENDKLSIYKVPFNPTNIRPIINKSQTHNPTRNKNHSLPSINFAKQQKVNVMRNQVEQANQQIAALKARLNTLKLERERNQKKKQKNQQKITFLQTVRERMFQEKEYKQKVNEKRDLELELMKRHANQLRQQLIKNREMSKSIVREQKFVEAEEQRQRKKDDEDYLMKVKSIEQLENQKRARNVKQSEFQIEEKLKEYKQSRVSFASKNHHEKYQKSLSDREKAEKTLKRLRKKQVKLIEDLKQSEAEMMDSTYELESINPQKKKKHGNSSSKASSRNIN